MRRLRPAGFRRRLNALELFSILLFLMVGLTPTASPAAGELSATLGVRKWFTTGYNEWNFSGAGVNVLGDLRWRGIDAFVTEFYGEVFRRRLGLLGSLGLAGIDRGVLVDEDFALSDRRGRFSHTRSDVDDGGLTRVAVDLAGRLFEWDRPLFGEKLSGVPAGGYLDVLLGYQYWREEYVAFGATGTSQISFRIKAVTQEYRWSTQRLGVRSQVPIVGSLSLKSHIVGLPYVDYELEDVHHLRADLRKDPSFSSESTEGWGIELDAALSYRDRKGFQVEAGYRYSRIDSGRGDKFTHAPTGTIRDRLNNTTFERYGPYLAVQYRW